MLVKEVMKLLANVPSDAEARLLTCRPNGEDGDAHDVESSICGLLVSRDKRIVLINEGIVLELSTSRFSIVDSLQEDV